MSSSLLHRAIMENRYHIIIVYTISDAQLSVLMATPSGRSHLDSKLNLVFTIDITIFPPYSCTARAGNYFLKLKKKMDYMAKHDHVPSTDTEDHVTQNSHCAIILAHPAWPVCVLILIRSLLSYYNTESIIYARVYVWVNVYSVSAGKVQTVVFTGGVIKI